jgi:hypothetical protein
MHNALLELGVNAAVVVGLALSLVLIRRLAGMTDDATTPLSSSRLPLRQ